MNKRAKKNQQIWIEAATADMGGVAIQYGGKLVAGGLNTMEAFVTLAGMLANGPRQVRISMSVVTESFLHHFNAGRKAVTPRLKK